MKSTHSGETDFLAAATARAAGIRAGHVIPRDVPSRGVETQSCTDPNCTACQKARS